MAQVLPDALRVEMGFGSSPLTALASVSWTDVTSSVMLSRGVQFSRGKSETDSTARPGTASFTLDNSKQAGGEGRWTTKTDSWAGTATWADSAISWDGYALTADGLVDETTGIGGKQPVALRIPVRISATYPFATKNLVSNPSFEANTTGWAGLASSTIAVDSTRSATGSQSGLVTWAAGAASSQAVIINCTTVTGQVYTVSFWVYVPSGNPDVAATCNLVSTGSTLTTKDRWVRISHTFTAGGTTSSVGVRNLSTATAGQLCYIDGVQCELGSTMTSYTDGAPSSIRLWVGYVEAVNTEWEDGYRPVVNIECSDRLARLQRKSLPSMILGEQLYDSPLAAWPLSESTSSAFGNRSTQSGVPSLAITQLGTGGTLTCAVEGSAPGPDGLAGATFARSSASNGKYLAATLPGTFYSTGDVTIECYFKLAATGFQAGLIAFSMFGGSSDSIQVYVDSAGKLCASTNQDGTISTITGSTTLVASTWYHAALVINRSTPLMTLYLNGSSQGTYTGSALANGLLQVAVGAYLDYATASLTNLFSGAIANVGIYQSALTATRVSEHATARYTAANDPGESSENKFKRICRIAPLPDADRTMQYGDSGATSATMSTFAVAGDNVYSALDKVAITEAGAIYLNRSGQIVLQSRDYRDAQSSQFNLPARAISSDTSFTLDMQTMVNDVTVSRPDGAEVRYVNTSSVAAYDTHDLSIEIYSSTDAAVTEMAAWESNVNAFPSQRVGDITIDLVTASLEVPVQTILAAEVGTWFKVTDLPASTSPTGSVDLFVEGITDRITESSWERSIVGSPASTSAVWILDDEALSILDDTTVLGF
jgi:hypothetical protein